INSGELLVVCSAGRERHVCPFGQVHIIRSVDNGESWSDPEILVNGPLDDRDAGILQTSKGTVMVNWFTSIAWLQHLESLEKEGRNTLPVDDLGQKLTDGFFSRCRKIRSLLNDDLIARELGTWIIRSADGGKTWSDKIDCGVGSPHGPTELTDGRLLFVGNAKHAPEAKSFNGTPYAANLVCCESCDDGLSWRQIGEIPQRQGDALGQYHEPHAVQTADKRIIVHIRNHSRQDCGCILQSESNDGGKTFSIPHNTGLLGLPAHLLRLKEGHLLTTYGYRHDPFGNRASISEDGGRSWGKPMILDEKTEGRDLGYPSTAELEDGSFLSVWYEKLPGDDLASLQAMRWKIS
ncbi:MAG: exo-alpha-sialidase, partial [Victivallales bacterium]|nr:exo-alpha-sialidase [Victivallales bacterium]